MALGAGSARARRLPAPPQAALGTDLDTQTLTSAIPLRADPKATISPSDSRDVATLKAGLDALAAGDIAGAREYREQLR